MKKKFLSYIRKNINNKYKNINSEKLNEIMYGVEAIYLTITKTIIIFFIAFLLGILKEMIILLITFNIIRSVAFGMHAKDSIACLLFSSTLFISSTYLCKILIIPRFILIILYVISLIIISIYSPADTEKRPLIKRNKRIKFKIISIVIVAFYFISTLFIKDDLLNNCLIIGLLIECILILPITYKIFSLPYNNYKNYNLNIK